MAKIVLSDLAPDVAVTYSLGTAEPFELGGSKNKTFETTDRELLSNAEAHPWLKVEYPKVDTVFYEAPSSHVAAKDDGFTAVGPNAGIPFDPAEIAKVEEAKGHSVAPLAVQAGLDQGEKVVDDGVAQTLAAAGDNVEKTEPEATKTKTTAKEKN